MRARQPLRAAAPQPGALGVLGPRGELAVEEHRHADLLADQRRRRERLADRRAAPLLVELDDRHHVERADVRVHARRARQVDVLHR